MERLIEQFPPAPVLPPRASILLELADRVARGTQVCILVGPSGSGKTYLARRLQTIISSHSQMVWATGIQQAGGAPPFSAVEHLTAVNGRSGWEEVPIELIYREELVGSLRALSKSRPIVLCCDDLEDFDAASLSWLISMLWRLDRLSVSLLLLLRERTGGSHLDSLWGELEACASSVCSFQIPRLTIDEVAGVCEKQLGGPIKFRARRLHWLQRLSHGSPLILSEYMAYLRESGWLTQTSRGWKLSPDTPATLPGFEEIVSRRLDTAAVREASFARNWIERGAIVGGRFAVPVSAIGSLLRIGEGTGYIKEVGPNSEFQFCHDGIRLAIEATALKRHPDLPVETMRLRAEVRSEEETDLALADLYQRIGPLDLAVDEVGIAAVTAGRSGFPSEAERLAIWQDALLERTGDPQESSPRLDVAELRAEALFSDSRFHEAVELLSPLESHAIRQLRPRLLFLLGAARSRLPGTTARAAALAYLWRALEIALEVGERRLEPYIHLELATALRMDREEGRGRKSFLRALSLARRVKNESLEIRILRQTRLFLEPEVAQRQAECALELCRRRNSAGSGGLSEALVLNNLGAVLSEMALLTDAEEKYWEALRILEEKGGWGMAVPLNNLALLAFYRGDWARADELFGSALDAADNEGIFLRIRCNRARLTAQEDPRSTVLELRELVPGRNAMNRALRSFVSFSLARTFVEAGCFREALLEAKSPPPWLGKDRDLAVAAWAQLRLRAYRGMGVKSVPEVNLLGKAKVLEETPKLQSWMYKDLWPVGEAIFD